MQQSGARLQAEDEGHDQDDVSMENLLSNSLECARNGLGGVPGCVAFFSYDYASQMWSASDNFRKILGIAPDYPCTLKAWLQLVHPEDRSGVEILLKSTVSTSRQFYCACRIVRPQDQRVCCISVCGDYLCDGQNVLVKLLGSLVDRTIDRAMQQGRALLNQAMQQTGTAVYLISKEGQCLYLNEEAELLHGWSPVEWPQHWLWEIDVLCTSAALWYECCERLRSVPVLMVESLHRDKHGTTFPVQIQTSFFAFEGESYVLGVVQDIREKKALEVELDQYKQHLEDRVRLKTLELDRLNGRLYRSVQLQKVLGQSSQLLLQVNREEVFRQRVCQLLASLGSVSIAWICYGMIQEATVQRVGVAASSPELISILDGYEWWKTPDALWSGLADVPLRVWTLKANSVEENNWLSHLYRLGIRKLLAFPFRLEDAQVGVLVFATNQEDFAKEDLLVLQELVHDFVRGISVLRLRQYHATAVNELALRVRNESAIRQQMQDLANRLQIIFDSMTQAIMVWDREQRLIYWNRWVQNIFPQSAPFMYRTMSRQDFIALLERENEMIGMFGEWDAWLSPSRENIHSSDGRIIDISRLIADDESRIVLLTDITEISGMRDTLIHNERLASLGSMVAGLAHELNTPIGVALTAGSSIRADVEQLLQQISLGQVKKAALMQLLDDVNIGTQLVEGNLRRAHQLISNFKQVAVDQTLAQRRVFELRSLVQEVMFTLQPVLKPGRHTWTMEQHQDIMMDSFPGPLGQVITNLVNNAVNHAFSAPGGKIHLHIVFHDDDHVEILFSDNGEGIRSEYLKRIFEPFFTTKMGQGGTGLGLHIVHNNVTKVLQGQIGVRSEIGAGTQFVVLLPRVVRDEAVEEGIADVDMHRIMH